MALPRAERADLLAMVNALSDDEPMENEGIPAEWDEEIARRLKSIEDGTAEFISIEESMANNLARLERAGSSEG